MTEGARDTGDRSIGKSLFPGRVIAEKYQIVRALGEGANGTVYEAKHAHIGHRVAIKVVHSSLAGRSDIATRFEREARICGTIRNRHVGQVYDFGVLPTGQPYLVMELHEGGSLGERLDRGPVPLAEAVDLSIQLLIGLQACHELGVVHRDVKPENIMLVPEPDGGVVLKLVDFGIVKTLLPSISARSVTMEGMIVGSPDYMAPEQLRGEAIDHRADLYAAGIVLYEMVTGGVPFNADTLTDLFVAILQSPVVPPRVIREDCSAALQGVILRAISRDAAERYETATAMARALTQTPLIDASLAPPASERPAEQPASRSQTRPIANPIDGIVTGSERAFTAAVRTERSRGAGMVFGLVLAGAFATAMLPQMLGRRPGAQVQGKLAATPGTAPSIIVESANPSSAADAASHHRAPPALPDQAERSSGKERGAAHPARRRLTTRGTERAKLAEPTLLEPVDPVTTTAVTDALVRQAATALARGKALEAQALYLDAVTRSPLSSEAWLGLGNASTRLEDRDQAASAFRHYLALEPTGTDAARVRGQLREWRIANP